MADDWAAAVEEQESSQLSDKLADVKLAGGDAAAAAAETPAANGDATGKSDTEEVATAADVSLLNKLLKTKVLDSKVDLECIQKDPNSPLYSVKSFEDLHLKPELLKGVYGMGFNAPSKIQETALPALLADPPQNMIAQSQSGTGKTAAFVLTMLSRADASKNYPQCLCLAPTYELALQIGEVITQMSQFMPNMNVRYAIRGERVNRGDKISEQILVGTPGTLLDWCVKFRFFDVKKVKVFVLDEADVMICTQGHQDQSVRIQRTLAKSCQMLMFSATFDEDVLKFAEAIIPDPIMIRLRREEESLDNIKQVYIECDSKEAKFTALSNIYGTISIGQSMIFCHTKRTANWLTEKMTGEGHAVALLTGELQVEQRAAVINRFREGKEKVLITTNVSARGIDVEQVTVVVNFDLPVTQQGQADCETYLHRIGRTGRFGKNGLAINMVDGYRSTRILEAIQKHFRRPIDRLDAEDMDEVEKIAENNK